MLTVAAFYQFVELTDFDQKREPLLALCRSAGVKGTILLAQEGINGTIAGSRPAINQVMDWLRSDPRLADLHPKESWAETMPFDRLKVKLKREIVTIGLAEVNPTQQVGTYVAPQDWNALISDPEVTVIDIRNHSEVRIGSFQGAQNPQTASFRQFPDYVRTNLDPTQHCKIALFCTGGIRCEKASSFLLAEGFQQVYHLQGGILKYLEEIPLEESLWSGECFVFDQRVAVQHDLAIGTHETCPSCGSPIAPADKALPRYQPGISCPYCCDPATRLPISVKVIRPEC